MESNVLIVGAGPAGAAGSILLARQGSRILLVDCATFPHDKAYAEYLSPTCPPLLAQFGVLDATLTVAPQRLQGMRVIDHRGRSCWRHFIQDGQCLYGLALPRLVLDYLLVAQACREGVELHTGFWV
jgi:2-polyprenyl-6-methoxyphenol hydroxylase-like FAD-dependent oxidoreductase